MIIIININNDNILAYFNKEIKNKFKINIDHNSNIKLIY